MATGTSSPFELRNSYNHFRVFRIAIFSRLLILTLIFLFRSLASPYDTSASINPNCISSSSTHLTRSEPVLFPAVGSAIESSIVWDAVYFVRIAECGYEYEQTYAFLPLLPICIRLLARSVLAPLVPIIGYRAVLGLSGYVINNIAFAFAAVYLYWLSILILKDSVAAFRASILFCFNPASIFYSSVYSESLYSLFSFGGIYHLLAGSNTIAVLLFALSGSARSNGVLNAGYFCFKALHQAYDSFFHKNRPFFAVGRLTLAAFQALCIFTPFITFQAYGYLNICLGSLPNEARPWCKSRVPLLYDYLQSHYWGVGFLRYFQLKQLPNFLLASPILSLAISSIIQYVKSRAEVVFSLGFGASHEEKEFASVLYSLDTNQRLMGVKSFSSKIAKGSFHFTRTKWDFRSITQITKQGTEDQALRQRKKKTETANSETLRDLTRPNHEAFPPSKIGFSSILVLPFVLHLGFMSVVAFFVMHVQVSTRFLSSSPPLYWFSSYLMVSSREGRTWAYLIWVYSVAYILLGSLLFSNFYPFT